MSRTVAILTRKILITTNLPTQASPLCCPRSNDVIMTSSQRDEAPICSLVWLMLNRVVYRLCRRGSGIGEVTWLWNCASLWQWNDPVTERKKLLCHNSRSDLWQLPLPESMKSFPICFFGRKIREYSGTFSKCNCNWQYRISLFRGDFDIVIRNEIPML